MDRNKAETVAPSTRKRMQSNRRRDTALELAVRSELHRRGLRYRVDHPVRAPGRRPIRPDVVFTRRRVAVFLDGCFWHGCPTHATWPKSNAGFWRDKIAANRRRDAENATRLTSEGWTVLRFWEHDSPDRIADEVERVIATKRGDESSPPPTASI